MALLINFLGSAVAALCAVLLLRGYARSRKRLLFWSGLCFAGLTASNLLWVVDLELVPDRDLFPFRLATAAIATLLLLYGLVFESDS
jgi:hypothetical protein